MHLEAGESKAYILFFSYLFMYMYLSHCDDFLTNVYHDNSWSNIQMVSLTG